MEITMEAEEEADPPPTRGFTTSTNQSGGFGRGRCRNCRINLVSDVDDDDVVTVVTSNTNSGKRVYNPRPHTIATTSQEYVKPRIDSINAMTIAAPSHAITDTGATAIFIMEVPMS